MQTIADHLVEGRYMAMKNGICPHYAHLGPVKYQAWRRWVKVEVGAKAPKPPDHETFYGMIIVPSEQPGIIIAAEKCTP